MRLVIAVAFALGCNRHSTTPANQCAEAARQGVGALVERAHVRIAAAQLPPDIRAKMDERTKQLDALAPRLRAVIANHCIDDKWPADVIACYAKATSLDELRACRGHLAPDEQAKLQREELELFAGAASVPGFTAASVPGFATVSPAPASPVVARLEAEQRELNTKLAEAVKQLEGSTSDADRAAARATVQALQSEMQVVSAKLATARGGAPIAP